EPLPCVRMREQRRVLPGVADLVDALPFGIVLQDTDGHVTEANQAAEDLLGLSVTDMRDMAARAPEWRAFWRDGRRMVLREQPSVVAVRTGRPQRDVVMGIDGPHGRRWLQAGA